MDLPCAGRQARRCRSEFWRSPARCALRADGDVGRHAFTGRIVPLASVRALMGALMGALGIFGVPPLHCRRCAAHFGLSLPPEWNDAVMNDAHPPTHEHDASESSAAPAVPVLPAETALLFEVSWEVCSQVGGIYTVLRTKTPATVRRWQDAYFAIGPYREASANVELEPQVPTGPLKAALDELAGQGMRLYFGHWLVPGRPQTILVDTECVSPRLAEIKYYLWKDNGVASPAGDYEFDEVVGFGSLVAEFLLALQRQLSGSRTTGPIP